jgi:hypothetical protein
MPGGAINSRDARSPRLAIWLSWLQGAYFFVAGVWPVTSIDSFEAVTGEKTDDWLVVTVGVLVAAIGLVLLRAAWRRRVSLDAAALALGSAAALAGVDVVYVFRDVIPPIYLADAAAEIVLVVAWLAAWPRLGHAD